MSTISETLYPTESHPGDSSAQTRTGERFRGDGFYNRADGFHTVQWTISDFHGAISIEASLAIDPDENDWFKVRLGNSNDFQIDTTGKVTRTLISEVCYNEETTGSFSYNFTGNYVWVRAYIEDWTSGHVNSILMSH